MAGEVEKPVLGAILSNPDLVDEALSKLSVDDFYLPYNRYIFQAISQLATEGKPSDPVNVMTQLGNDLDRAGGGVYLFDLVQAASLPAHLPSHIDALKAATLKRKLADVGERITLFAQELPAHEAAEKSQALMDDLVTVDESDVIRAGDALEETLIKIADVQLGETPQGLMSGFYDLDALTNGFQPGQMVIIAARPGVGKSTLAVDFMRHMSIKEGRPSMLFSLEMSREEVVQRIVSAESEVPLERMKRKGGMNESDWNAIKSIEEKIRVAPFIIDDSAETTILDVVAKTKMMVKREGVQMVVVDYLQLIKSSGQVESRQQEVAGYSRQLKLLAKACGIPVIAVAQLNRESEKRGDDARPKASDLRESGALEQDADVILLIHRPDKNNEDHERAGEADVIVAKNRGGRQGIATLASRLHVAKFDNSRRFQ